jgi:hypothetical protein
MMRESWHQCYSFNPMHATTQSTELIFLTADNRLSAIAQAFGLLTDNPNHHP